MRNGRQGHSLSGLVLLGLPMSGAFQVPFAEVLRELHGLLAEPGRSETFTIVRDSARHRKSGIPVDVLFGGDDWDLPFLLPDPTTVREWEPSIGAWFIRPTALLELKAAVYLSKNAEYGPATAARDLADVHALLQVNGYLRGDETIHSLHPSVRDVVRTAAREVERYRSKKPR